MCIILRGRSSNWQPVLAAVNFDIRLQIEGDFVVHLGRLLRVLVCCMGSGVLFPCGLVVRL